MRFGEKSGGSLRYRSPKPHSQTRAEAGLFEGPEHSGESLGWRRLEQR
jgi:hypothetical protein